jgi:hypothetical protein
MFSRQKKADFVGCETTRADNAWKRTVGFSREQPGSLWCWVQMILEWIEAEGRCLRCCVFRVDEAPTAG